MRRAVVALPQPSQSVLPADIPQLKVDGRIRGREGERNRVLADCGDGFEVRMRGRVGCFYLLEERGFARVVEAEEKDRVLWTTSAEEMEVRGAGTVTFFACGVQVD